MNQLDEHELQELLLDDVDEQEHELHEQLDDEELLLDELHDELLHDVDEQEQLDDELDVEQLDDELDEHEQDVTLADAATTDPILISLETALLTCPSTVSTSVAESTDPVVV